MKLLAARLSQIGIEDSLQQAAGNLPRKEFESIYNSLAIAGQAAAKNLKGKRRWSAETISGMASTRAPLLYSDPRQLD